MPMRCKCKAMKQIGYCLIRAKVDLEYGAGFALGSNEHLTGCRDEIEKALDWTFIKDDEEDYEETAYELTPPKIPIGWMCMIPLTHTPKKGWLECDGENDTPDLRDDYIEGKYKFKVIMKMEDIEDET